MKKRENLREDALCHNTRCYEIPFQTNDSLRVFENWHSYSTCTMKVTSVLGCNGARIHIVLADFQFLYVRASCVVVFV